MTISNASLRQVRIKSSVMLATAGAGVAGLLGVATPANAAADAYVALSVGYVNDAPPVQTVGGMSIGPDNDQAAHASLSNCVGNGGGQCVFEISAKNACAAAAANDYGEIEAASDPSLQVAQQGARNKLQNQQGAHIVVSGCSNGQAAPPPPNQPPPPKLGPTVTFNPILGGLQARITDRSGVSSQCTYVTDNVNRSFALPANSTYNLKIVPAIPQFRNWNVTITCDNGTSTKATTYF